jgi:bacillithiol system protein YtxJ
MDSTRISGAFAPLVSPEQFDALLETSHQRPLAIFKHSGACGTSAQAYDELEAFLQEGGSDAEVYLVDVLANGQLSQAITARFRVRHESPQVLVISNAEVRWHGSHFRVTAENVRKAFLDHTKPYGSP